MTNRRKLNPGDLIKISLKDGLHTYARVLIEGSCAIYDCVSSEERKDYKNIIKSSILFVTRVFISTVNSGGWTIVTNIKLEESLVNYYPRYFNPSPQKIECINFYEIYKSEIEDAIAKDWIKTGGIQLDGVPQHFHVEERIRDYYDGKRNQDNKASIWFFKHMLGMTSLSFEDF